MKIDTVREIALSFPETNEEPHFEKSSFRVKKKIFATYDQKNNTVNLKLDPADQDVFSAFDRSAVHPVDNKWGLQGWTVFHLDTVHPEIMKDALKCAYIEVAPKGLSEQLTK